MTVADRPRPVVQLAEFNVPKRPVMIDGSEATAVTTVPVDGRRDVR